MHNHTCSIPYAAAESSLDVFFVSSNAWGASSALLLRLPQAGKRWQHQPNQLLGVVWCIWYTIDIPFLYLLVMWPNHSRICTELCICLDQTKIEPMIWTIFISPEFHKINQYLSQRLEQCLTNFKISPLTIHHNLPQPVIQLEAISFPSCDVEPLTPWLQPQEARRDNDQFLSSMIPWDISFGMKNIYFLDDRVLQDVLRNHAIICWVWIEKTSLGLIQLVSFCHSDSHAIGSKSHPRKELSNGITCEAFC